MSSFQANEFVKYNFENIRKLHGDRKREVEQIPDRNERARQMVALNYSLKKLQEAEKLQRSFDLTFE